MERWNIWLTKWTPRMEMGDQQDTDRRTSKHATIAAASGLTLWRQGDPVEWEEGVVAGYGSTLLCTWSTTHHGILAVLSTVPTLLTRLSMMSSCSSGSSWMDVWQDSLCSGISSHGARDGMSAGGCVVSSVSRMQACTLLCNHSIPCDAAVSVACAERQRAAWFTRWWPPSQWVPTIPAEGVPRLVVIWPAIGTTTK